MARPPRPKEPPNLALLQGGIDSTVGAITGHSVDRAANVKALWRPDPRNAPQCSAYTCEADELFFGGSAGGGKTDLAIGLALTAHRNSIIFRRIYKSLTAIVDRVGDILGTRDGLNQSRYIWRLPYDRKVEFGAVEHEESKTAYQGQPHDLYVFDEAPEFTLSQVLFITAWARSTVPGQRVRIVLTGNPPTTPDGYWIAERYAAWINPAHPNRALPGEIRWYAMIGDKDTAVKDGTPFEHNGETVIPRSRTFIPAKVGDNPYYAGTNYVSVLQSLPEPLRSQLLYGDFSITAADDLWQAIPTKWVQAAQARWEKTEKPDLALRAIGVDVAHGGADRTVIAQIFGTWFAPLLVYSGKETPDGESVAKLVDDVWDRKARIGVDAIGVGASAVDTMRNWRMNPRPINFGGKSKRLDKTRRFGYFNLRAEAYWRFREALDPQSGEEIALPPSRELLADLCAVKFRVQRGKILIDPKQDIKKVIGRSPDSGDTVVLGWFTAVAGGYTDEDIEKIGSNEIDYRKLDKDLLDAMRMSGVDVDKEIERLNEADRKKEESE